MVTMVETRVGKVAYSDVGEGPAVVLLHATLHDRHDFDPIAGPLSRDHRVIALDWPGHGESPAPVSNYQPTAASFADVLADVVAALSLQRVALIGNSVGGFAAARLAIADPQLVSRLVLVNSGGFIASPVTNLYCRLLGTPGSDETRPAALHSQLYEGIQRQRQRRARTRAGTGEHPRGCSAHGVDVAQLRRARIRSAPTRRPHHRAMPGDLGIERHRNPYAARPIYGCRDTGCAAGGPANRPYPVLLGPCWILGRCRAVSGRRTRQRAVIGNESA